MLKMCFQCKELKKHQAKGLCNKCYLIAWKQTHPEHKIKDREYHKEYDKQRQHSVTYKQKHNKRQCWRKIVRHGSKDGIMFRCYCGKMIKIPFNENQIKLSLDYSKFLKTLKRACKKYH